MTLEAIKENIEELILRYGKDTDVIFMKKELDGGSHPINLDFFGNYESDAMSFRYLEIRV